MAKGTQSVFAEDSDEDSINTTTTPESDGDTEREYDVERVLAETLGEDGKTMYYLLKWEGYPLYDCTWEKKENITSDVLLRHWETDKRLARQGQKPLFDVGEYEQAVEQHLETQERKRRFRIAKRRKRGEDLPSSSEEEGEYGEDLPTTEAPKRTKVKLSPVKRKGRAQPVVKRCNKITGTTNEDVWSPEDAQDSDVDSLFGERKKTSPAPNTPKQKGPAIVTSAPLAQGEMSTRTSGAKKPGNATASSGLKTTTSSTKETASTGAARKTAPSTATKTAATAKRSSSSNVFAGDWTKEKKRRQRVRVSGETPKDSTEQKFNLLSIQNRYQKYSKNEPAPDPNALATVDPKTGRVQPPKTAVKKAGPDNIHSAYGRRRTPPPSKARSPSPQSPEAPKRTEAQVRAEPPPVTIGGTILPQADNANSVVRQSDHDFRKSTTCKYWQSGNCRFTAETCAFAHSYPEADKKKRITCYYWYHGNKCRKTPQQCDFAHEDTGEYAGPPGSFRRRSMAADAPLFVKDSDLNLMRNTSPTLDEAIILSVESPLPAPLQTDSSVFVKPPETSNDQGAIASASVEKVTDPRLRGRPAPASDTNIIPATEPQLVARPTEALDDTSEIAVVDDDEPSLYGSLDADLEMAKRGIRKLDANRLLALSNGKSKEIENIYIHMPDRSAELDLLRKYFEGLKRRVYHSGSIGAWDFFRSRYGGCCLVIVHPSELFLGSLPGLHELLVEYGAGTRVFSLGVQYEQCLREGREPAYDAQRLFPHGGITFITDDVFSYFPEKAKEIIESFLEQTKSKPPGAELAKIGARPGVKDWLLQLASKKFEEQRGYGESADLPWIECYEALCRLCPLEDEEPDFPDHHVPLETSNLWSLWEDSLPSFKGRWESGDEEGATDYMANLFAGEACCRAWKYRKFHFVYQRPGQEKQVMSSQGYPEIQQEADPKGWAKKYCHIGVVTPDQVLKRKR